MSSAWRHAVCTEVRDETPTARTIRLRVDDLGEVVAGQHVDVRLTADDGYQAVRSYSLSAGPLAGPFGRPLPAGEVEITVEELDDGEVSPFLVEALEVGDPMEVRGPVGGWFVWRAGNPAPVQLISGGSGIAPLMAMARARVGTVEGPEFRMLYSARTPTDVYYRDELAAFVANGSVRVDTVYTRVAPVGSGRKPGRLDRELLAELTVPPALSGVFYVCGPNGFVEVVAEHLAALGHDPSRIRTERFGGT